MVRTQPDNYAHWNGLTKREAFAMAALQGVVARVNISAADAARQAVEHADALINQLNKETYK